MRRRPLVVLAAVAVALPLAGAIAPASGLTSRGVSTPLGVHASRHRHLHALSSSEVVATHTRPPITIARRVPEQPYDPPVRTHPTAHQPTEHVKKHHKPTSGGSGPPPAPKKKSH